MASLGREVWEFEPDAGSPEERAEVERLRRDYARNRFTQRECGDLLMRMQESQVHDYAKQKLHNTNLPFIKINIEDSEVTEEAILTTLRLALNQYCSLQAEDGHWPGGFSGILFILPIMHVMRMVVGAHILWGPSSMFGTCVNYATLRLLGEVPNGENEALARGRCLDFVTWKCNCSTAMGKRCTSRLSTTGQEIMQIVPELWMLPYFSSNSSRKIFGASVGWFTLPMAYIYGKKVCWPYHSNYFGNEEMRSTIYHIVRSIGTRPCSSCAKDDLIYHPSLFQSIAMAFLNKFVEPISN
ncbi:hypothetical protein ACP4OV_028989 [Aristida adscensionis]